MVKFYEFLNESNIGNLDKIIEEIRSNCKPYLKTLSFEPRKNNYFVTGKEKNDEFLEYIIREDRKPRNTQKWIHDYMDEEFNKKFGVKARGNSLFCYQYSYDRIKSDIDYNFGYGFLIFPIGDFKFIYHRNIRDWYLTFEEYFDSVLMKELEIDFRVKLRFLQYPDEYPKLKEEIEKKISQWVNDYEIWNKKDKNYYAEFMLNCHSAYLINLNKYLVPKNKVKYFLENVLDKRE